MARRKTSVARPRFCELFYEHLHRACQRMETSQEKLSSKISKSRVTLSGATRTPMAIGLDTLLAFCNFAGLKPRERDDLVYEWISYRLREVRLLRPAARVAMDALETQLSEGQLKRVKRAMVRAQIEHGTSGSR